MKTVGVLLRSAREQNQVAVSELSRITKIKPEFIEAIETERWEKLPELPVLMGFVKSIADALNINRDQAVAFLRRDYPPKKLSINPKPDIKRDIRFGPRTLVVALGAVVILLMGGYLWYQYKSFTSAPSLVLISPTENDRIVGNSVTVRGTTSTGAVVKVNSQPALLDDDGNFNLEIEVVPETKSIEVKATSRSGRESTISRRIEVVKK